MLTWLQFGDLHACQEDNWHSLSVFERLVEEANAHLVGAIDLGVLSGDNAHHADETEFGRIADIAKRLRVPLYALPGDRDFQTGSLDLFYRYLSAPALPHAATIGGARCLFLDIVSAGSGGADFRLGTRQDIWLRRELDRADADGLAPVVFMHAYPGNLTSGADEVAEALSSGGARFVGTGHTHYNEVLNDGRVIYSATRSTGQSEEGTPGFSLGSLDGDAVSWRFKELGTPWPFVLITCPADVRVVTDAQSRGQVPVGGISVCAKVFGAGGAFDVRSHLAGGPEIALVEGEGHVWSGRFDDVPDGLHRLEVTATAPGGDRDTDVIDVLVRGPGARPKRGPTFAPGRDIHSVGPWPARGIPGGQLGPNKNGRQW